MNNKQLGMSLVELMVAMVISLLLILGVTELFSRTSVSDRANTELARMQESGRVALEIIGQDARRAGFQGCVASDTRTAFPGGGTLPDDAVSSTANTNVTFRYATPGSGCKTVALNFEPAITYANAGGSITRNGDPVLDNASMQVSFAPANNAVTANSINIQITVSDSRASSEALSNRTFSGTYELRNRL